MSDQAPKIAEFFVATRAMPTDERLAELNRSFPSFPGMYAPVVIADPVSRFGNRYLAAWCAHLPSPAELVAAETRNGARQFRLACFECCQVAARFHLSHAVLSADERRNGRAIPPPGPAIPTHPFFLRFRPRAGMAPAMAAQPARRTCRLCHEPEPKRTTI
jgi:hypothetical protein